VPNAFGVADYRISKGFPQRAILDGKHVGYVVYQHTPTTWMFEKSKEPGRLHAVHPSRVTFIPGKRSRVPRQP
jgi:hypothetical protein